MNNYSNKNDVGGEGFPASLRKDAALSKSNNIVTNKQPNFNTPDLSFNLMGIRAGSRSLREFERGKRILQSQNLSPDEYYLLLNELASYVGV
jgi:hypothetical protein